LTVIEVAAPDPEVVFSEVVPIYGVTVYEVMGLPPSGGAVKKTVAWALPAVAVTFVGAPGAVGGDPMILP
jgi:hypothetical protein